MWGCTLLLIPKHYIFFSFAQFNNFFWLSCSMINFLLSFYFELIHSWNSLSVASWIIHMTLSKLKDKQQWSIWRVVTHDSWTWYSFIVSYPEVPCGLALIIIFVGQILLGTLTLVVNVIHMYMSCLPVYWWVNWLSDKVTLFYPGKWSTTLLLSLLPRPDLLLKF